MKLRTRRFLQWTLDRAFDFGAIFKWTWFCFEVMHLQRKLGLRYWSNGRKKK